MPAIKSRAGILALLLFSGAAPAAATGLRFIDATNGIAVVADWFQNGIFVNDFPVQKGPGYDNVGTITLPRNQTIRFRATFDTDHTNGYPPAEDGTSVFYIVPRKGSTQIDGMLSYTLSTSGETHTIEGWYMGKTNPLLPVSVPGDTRPTHVFVGAFVITNGTPGVSNPLNQGLVPAVELSLTVYEKGLPPRVFSSISVPEPTGRSTAIFIAPPVCLADKHQRCTPDQSSVESLGPGRYHVRLPANLVVSIPNPGGGKVAVSNAAGDVCWDASLPEAYGCNGPEGNGNLAGAAFVAPAGKAGALTVATEQGRTDLMVNGRSANTIRKPDGSISGFSGHEGYFDFDVEIR